MTPTFPSLACPDTEQWVCALNGRRWKDCGRVLGDLSGSAFDQGYPFSQFRNQSWNGCWNSSESAQKTSQIRLDQSDEENDAGYKKSAGNGRFYALSSPLFPMKLRSDPHHTTPRFIPMIKPGNGSSVTHARPWSRFIPMIKHPSQEETRSWSQE